MKAIFSLFIGANRGTPVPVLELKAVVGRHFDCFSTHPVEGWSGGERNPGWCVKIATNFLPQVVSLALTLRREYHQDRVGIELAGGYVECAAQDTRESLLAALRNALPATSPARKRVKPGPWMELRECSRDEPGLQSQWTDYVRAISDEHFAWGKSIKHEDDDEIEIDSGSAVFIASYLLDEDYGPEELDALVQEHPEFGPLRSAMVAATS